MAGTHLVGKKVQCCFEQGRTRAFFEKNTTIRREGIEEGDREGGRKGGRERPGENGASDNMEWSRMLDGEETRDREQVGGLSKA